MGICSQFLEAQLLWLARSVHLRSVSGTRPAAPCCCFCWWHGVVWCPGKQRRGKVLGISSALPTLTSSFSCSLDSGKSKGKASLEISLFSLGMCFGFQASFEFRPGNPGRRKGVNSPRIWWNSEFYFLPSIFFLPFTVQSLQIVVPCLNFRINLEIKSLSSGCFWATQEGFVNENSRFNKMMLKEIKSKMQWKLEDRKTTSISSITNIKTCFHL